MKLYDSGRAPNPRRVRIFLAEKGISLPPLAPVDINALQQREPAFLSVNPLGRTPALVLDDGTAIAESVAICRYFEEVQPDPPLFGTGPVERATVEMWQRRVELELFLAVAAVVRHLHPAMAAMEAPQVTAWGEANRPKVERALRFLDAHLASHRFLCGETFTIADITGLVALDFMRLPKLPIPDDVPHLRRWHADLSERPSAKA